MDVSCPRSSDNKNLSLSRGSADEFKFSCQPCAGDGRHVEAVGLCQNCLEYVCETCDKHHSKSNETGHNILFDNDNISTDRKPTSQKLECTLTCTKHISQIVKFVCRQHDAVGCGDCMILGHKSCKVDYISDISKTFVDGQEYLELIAKVKQLKTSVTTVKREIEEDVNEVDRLYAKAVSDIRSFRKQVDTYLEDMEQELLDQCEKLKKINNTMIKDIRNELQPIKLELEDINSQLTSQAKASGDIFEQAKQVSNRLDTIGEELKFLDARKEPSMYTFDKNNQVLNYLKTKQGYLGDLRAIQIRKRLVRSPQRIRDFIPNFVGEISVKSSEDKTKCRITGITYIASETLACADYDNNSVKLIDIRADTITSEIKLTAGPWDVTYVSYDQLAVTVTNERKIHFLSFRCGLSKTRSIDVGGKCDGIAYTKDRLLVSFVEPPKVEILGLDGKVLQRFDTDSSGEALFHCPRHVAVEFDGNCFYVSDVCYHSVTKMSLSGEVLATYKDENLICPEGIAVCSEGGVLVCNSRNDNLHLLSSECKKIKILLEKTEWPQTLCFDRESGSLILNLERSKNDKILKYTLT